MTSLWNLFFIPLLLIVILFVGFTFANPEILISAPERSSPSDWIKEEQIKVYQDKIILNIQNANWSKFTNTNSMDPFLDEDANAIEILPENPQDIKVGDIISYNTVFGILIHRVIEVGEDEAGLYYLVKGDNNIFRDPFKVRYEDLQGVLVAIIY